MGDTKSLVTTESGNIPLLRERGFQLRILPNRRSPGGYALYEFQDDLPLSGTTYPTAGGRAFYQVGDLILTAKLQAALFLKSFPELQKTFPVDDPMILLANAFGATQASGWVVRKIRLGTRPIFGKRSEGYGWVDMERVLIFGKHPTLTGIVRQRSVDLLGDDFIYARLARSKRIVLIAAEIVTDLSIAMLTAGAGGAAGAVRKEGLSLIRRVFMRRAGTIFFVGWMRSELSKVGLRGTLAFVEAFVQTYATANFQDAVRSGINSAEVKPEPTALKRAITAGTMAFLQALLGVTESKMLERFRKGLPALYRVKDNPASFRAWMAEYLLERFVKTFSTGAVSRLLEIIGQALDDWILDKQTKSFASYLAPENQNELDNFIKGEILAILRGMIDLGGGAMATNE